MVDEQSLIELQNVTLRRGIGLGGPFTRRRQVSVFQNLSLQLPKRGLWLVSGESGSGKSSLLLLLAGVLKPTEGKLLIHGEGTARLSRRRRRKLFGSFGYLSQDEDCWQLASQAEEIDEAVWQQAAESFDLTKRNGKLANQSRWERLALALTQRYLVSSKLLLLDDPLAGLSINEIKRLLSWLESVSEERLILLADPGRRDLESLAGGVIHLTAKP